jgi:restriction endonuclease TaqI-like protein
VFIAPFDELDVEPDRKLPLVMTRDIRAGTVEWRGLGVINPFAPEGGLVKLEQYPRLQRYLMRHEARITARHCAQKAPASWYRTIDRIDPELVNRPKLLIPDIKGEAHIVYEPGTLYPHHNLYYITSETWDLKALRAVLRSGIARLFVAAYSTRMRGGYLRFQAQYLRRIRVPYWQDVPDNLKRSLVDAADRQDIVTANQVVFQLYGLSREEREALGGNGE